MVIYFDASFKLDQGVDASGMIYMHLMHPNNSTLRTIHVWH